MAFEEIKKDLNQLMLLLWKNFRLQLRSPIGLFFEIFAPALFAIILLPIRTIVKSETFIEPTLYEPFEINRLNSSLEKLNIAYQPSNITIINDIMSKVARDLNMNTTSFDDENTMELYVVNNSRAYLGGISFLKTSLDDFKYKIRLSHTPKNPGPDQQFSSSGTGNWKTQYLYPSFPVIGPRNRQYYDGGGPGYNREGFLQLQRSIDLALISAYKPDVYDIVLKLKRFPYPPYEDDQFVLVIQLLFPFIIMLSFIITIILTAKSIVYEKETGIKESMRLMGMKTWVYWLSWYIKTFIIILPSIIFMVISYKIKIGIPDGKKASIIDKTDPFLFAIFLILYASGSITFCFMCTTFFKKANNGAAGAGIIWFLSYLPFIFIQIRYEEVSLFLKTIVCFVNNLAMSMGLQLIGQFEGKGTGVNFDNWTTGVSVDDDFAMITVIIFLFFNNFIHMIITYYLDQVLPGEHGIARPWYFPISACIPSKFSRVKSNSVELKINDQEINDFKAKNVEDEVFIEDESIYSNRNIGIKIIGLFKVFKQFGKLKTAVSNLYLNIYENQITVLLGHNGAGKSTTISMITGLAKSTSGKILINGLDIIEKTKEARTFIGFCPQHNLLFDDLTVYEHLKFFAKLKNNFDEQEIDNMLDIINLSDKKHALAKTLSGGMKRKLSVSIAFIGKSSIVILDEPSSGMDPQARHSTWSLLQKFKKERKCTILLTTHFMDEADFLGDRIAIMSKGTLRCCGSPIYLKSKYSSGYNLVLSKKKKTDELNDVKAIATSYEIDNKSITLVKNIIPDSKVNENLASEISFVLPSEQTEKFSELFEKLEREKENLNVENIGISISTLEDVFLKINEYEDEAIETTQFQEENKINPIESDEINPDPEKCPEDKNFKEYGLWVGSQSTELVFGFRLVLQQFMALLNKRYVHAIRNKALTITQMLIPVGVMLIQLLYLKYAPLKPADSPSAEIDMARYSRNYAPFQVNSDDQSMINFLKQLSLVYEKQFEPFTNSEAFDLDQKSIYNQCNNSRNSINEYLLCVGELNIAYLNDNNVVGATFESDTSINVSIIGHFNNQAYHVPPLTLNFITNTLLKFYSQLDQCKISVINHPLPRNLTEKLFDFVENDPTSFNVATGLTFGFGFLLASFVVFLIKEKTTNSRHIQYLAGCSPTLYWTNALIWDFISFLIPTFIVMGLLWALDVKDYVEGDQWVYTFFLLFFYGLAHTPQMYLFSFAFKISATGLAALTVWNVITSQATLTPVNILALPSLNLADISKILDNVFAVLFPNYDIGFNFNYFLFNH